VVRSRQLLPVLIVQPIQLPRVWFFFFFFVIEVAKFDIESHSFGTEDGSVRIVDAITLHAKKVISGVARLK
jgi:hypothetical protein